MTGRLAIGIDIGGTHLRAARVSEAGEALAVRAVATRREPEAVLADVLALVAELRTPEVVGVGIGVPGRVDAETRAVLSGGYVDLSAMPFADRVEEATGLPVVVENDAAMALLAEQAIAGAAWGFGNVVMLTVGTGIGGAALERGRLVRGRRAAGQFGHLVVSPDGPPCLCGRRGCLETVSSGTALGRLMAEAGFPKGTRAADLLARAAEPEAGAVLRAWAGPLRRAIDSLVAALDPEVVVLGGGLGAEAAAALETLPSPDSPWFGAPVRAAALGDAAGVIGAARAALLRPGKRALLVNGVPASGKSTVARAVSEALGWPLLTLDTVKQPFLDELPPGDRLFNRMLGRASYRAIWDLIRDAPEGTGFVVDAWFGFQPPDALAEGLSRAGIAGAAEVWCEAPPEEVGRRYAARVAERGPGHPGLDYVPELVELARRAAPTGLVPVRRVDTTEPLRLPDLLGWAADLPSFPRPHQAP